MKSCLFRCLEFAQKLQETARYFRTYAADRPDVAEIVGNHLAHLEAIAARIEEDTLRALAPLSLETHVSETPASLPAPRRE